MPCSPLVADVIVVDNLAQEDELGRFRTSPAASDRNCPKAGAQLSTTAMFGTLSTEGITTSDSLGEHAPISASLHPVQALPSDDLSHSSFQVLGHQCEQQGKVVPGGHLNWMGTDSV